MVILVIWGENEIVCISEKHNWDIKIEKLTGNKYTEIGKVWDFEGKVGNWCNWTEIR